MICAIMQPTFFPWLGYFDMIDQSEKFILLDDVQMVKQSWQVRNRIKTANGPLLLSIPIKKKLLLSERTIKLAEINYDLNWEEKHLNNINNAYFKSSYFNIVFPKIKSIYDRHIQHLGELNTLFITTIVKEIGIDTEIITSSALDETEGRKDARLTYLCKKVGADKYLSPQGSAVYIESKSPGGNLAENDIDVYYHNYNHPVYKQLYGDFIPYMSIIDLLFNVGFDDALEVIRSGRDRNYPSWEFREKIMKIS